jgi:hypothetical protein
MSRNAPKPAAAVEAALRADACCGIIIITS